MSAPPLERPATGTGITGFLRGVRRVAEAMATPLVPEDYLDLVDPLRSGADLRGRIVDVRPETADAVTVVIRPGRGWAGHVPGQYIRIGVDVDGVRQWRAYSLTHGGPRPGSTRVPAGCIAITVKAIPDGKVSNHLVRNTRPGTLVMLDQATGNFVLPASLPAKALFITAGSGITPVMGMLRHYLPGMPDVVHVHCAPSSDQVLFKEDLDFFELRPGYQLTMNLDDTDGVLDLAARLDELVPDWADRQAWVCGPTGLLDDAETHWESKGLTDRLHVERFRPSIVEPGEGGEITFTESAVLVEADGATPILDAGEDADVLMPSGCRMGICFGCVVTLRSGAVRDLRTGEVTVIEDGDGELPIQTCVNAVAGACEIEL